MPRSPQQLPLGVRITDKITVGLLHRIFPKTVVLSSLQAVEKSTIRVRELPNDLVVYFVILLALFRDVSQTEVLNLVVESLQWLYGITNFKTTGKSGISQARSRVGWEPMKSVFDSCAKPLAKPNSRGCFYRGKRLVAVDGTMFNVEDCPENLEAFGRLRNQIKDGPYPQVRAVGLLECGTHAVFGLAIGKAHTSELELVEEVVGRLDSGMLCLADRFYMSYGLFERAHATGADLLFRARWDRQLPVEQVLEDGSYLSVIFQDGHRRPGTPRMTVRVIEYDLPGGSKEAYRLITTMLDPESAPAVELAALYRERWEFETALAEVKTQLNDGSMALRSRTPDLVRQEIYGLFMAHYAIRSMMYDAAYTEDLDPDVLSFTHAVRVIRRKMPSFGAFSPSRVALPN